MRRDTDIRHELLTEALDLITGDRHDTHGDYRVEAARIGKAWAAILGLPDLEPHVVAAMMLALKGIRATSPGRANVDDWRDAIGYAALGAYVDRRL